MKAKSLVVNGQTWHFTFQGAYWTGPVTNAVWSLNVVPGAIVHGNKHDPNAWNYTVRDNGCFHGYIQHHTYGSGSQFDGYYWGPFGGGSDQPKEPPYEQNLVYNMALSRINEKIRGALDLSIDLAEAKLTQRMIATMGKVETYLQWLFKHKPTKDLANGWLLWQYGWRPLMSTIYGIADEAIRIVLNGNQKFKSKATLPLEGNSIVKRNIYGVPCVNVRRTGQGVQSCTIHVSIEVPDFDLARWTSLNPISIAWELTPYSFVVDWLLDVGSYLRNFETAMLYAKRFRGGYVSELYAWKGHEATTEVVLTDLFGSWKYVQASASLRYIQFRRTTLSAYPFPRIPPVKVDMCSQRIISAAALLRQLF